MLLMIVQNAFLKKSVFRVKAILHDINGSNFKSYALHVNYKDSKHNLT